MYNFFKRLFDIVCSLIGIVGTSPFWLIAILGIEFSDPGPIFYVAKRIGKNNREFKMFKFRSMKIVKMLTRVISRQIQIVSFLLDVLSGQQKLMNCLSF